MKMRRKKKKKEKETDEGRDGGRSQKGYSLFSTFLTIYIESGASFKFFMLLLTRFLTLCTLRLATLSVLLITVIIAI